MPFPPQGIPKTWTFTELAGGEDHQVSSADTWEDWPLSAIVPAGTVAVLVHVKSRGNWGVRKYGSALDRKGFSCGDDTIHRSAFISAEVEVNRVIEVYTETNVGYALYSIVGYWSVTAPS